MNTVGLSNRLTSKVPYWSELQKLSKEDKINVIAMLSLSIADTSDAVISSENRTQEMIDRCCSSWTGTQTAEETPAEKTKRMIAKYAGCWNGNDSADDTIRAIIDGRHSTMEPLSF